MHKIFFLTLVCLHIKHEYSLPEFTQNMHSIDTLSIFPCCIPQPSLCAQYNDRGLRAEGKEEIFSIIYWKQNKLYYHWFSSLIGRLNDTKGHNISVRSIKGDMILTIYCHNTDECDIRWDGNTVHQCSPVLMY